jgi:hypothetical protein
MTTTPHRPGPLRWLWYAVGGGLPPRYSAWVLHDATCRTWFLRHLLRTVILIAVPVVLVAVFVPAPVGIRVLTAVTCGLCAIMFAVVHSIETTERRVVRAGYVGGTAEAVRGQRAIEAQRAANAARRARRERIAARRR